VVLDDVLELVGGVHSELLHTLTDAELRVKLPLIVSLLDLVIDPVSPEVEIIYGISTRIEHSVNPVQLEEGSLPWLIKE
jgi:hypothetical protein